MFLAYPQNSFFSNKGCYKRKKYEFVNKLLLSKIQIKEHLCIILLKRREDKG